MSAVNKPEHALLNEYAQKKGTDKPEYFFIDQLVGSRKEFTASCKFQGKVTKGSASNKSEAKRISAGNMLQILGVIGDFVSTKKAQAESVILSSNKLENFDRESLKIHLDKYLETREKDENKFRQLFVGGMPAENNVDEGELPNDTNSPKSKTLEKLAGISAVKSVDACSIFKAIVREMKLSYFAEFLETSKNDRYAVVIKLSINLFTAGGVGKTPEEAIEECCKNAIDFFYLFNL